MYAVLQAVRQCSPQWGLPPLLRAVTSRHAVTGATARLPRKTQSGASYCHLTGQFRGWEPNVLIHPLRGREAGRWTARIRMNFCTVLLNLLCRMAFLEASLRSDAELLDWFRCVDGPS